MALLTDSQKRAYDNLYNCVKNQERVKPTSYLDLFGRAIIHEISEFLIQPGSSLEVNTKILNTWHKNPLIARLFCQHDYIKVQNALWLKKLKKYNYFTALFIPWSTGPWSGPRMKNNTFENYQIIETFTHLRRLEMPYYNDGQDFFPILVNLPHLNYLKIRVDHLDTNLQFLKLKHLDISQSNKTRDEELSYNDIYNVFPNIMSLTAENFNNSDTNEILQFENLNTLNVPFIVNCDFNQLTNLQNLEFRHIPRNNDVHISNLTNLTQIQGLTNNFEEVQYCTKLRKLHLPNSHISIPWITSLENLTQLIIEHNIQYTQNTINNLVLLKKLTIINPLFSNDIEQLTNIEYLNIQTDYNNNINLSRLVKLKYLYVKGYINLNNVNLESLYTLEINYLSNQNSIDTTNLHQARRLKKLYIAFDSSRDLVENIIQLPLLEDLYFHHRPYRYDKLRHCPRLKKLRFSGSCFNKKRLPKFIKHIKTLQYFGYLESRVKKLLKQDPEYSHILNL